MSDEPHSSVLPIPGQQFGPYTVGAEIGRGGFAKIYKAHSPTGETHALKVLVPEDVGSTLYSEELAARFHREAAVLRGVRTPYAVRMYEFGESETGLLYMVFEYLDGKTVSELLVDGPLALETVERALPQLLSALDTVHAAGLLHRDLKPSNIMLCRVGNDPAQVKLIDFGIAKAYKPGGSAGYVPDLTAKGQAIGTPRYMAPEQILGQTCTPSTDLYSLACVIAEMLSGRRLVEGDDPVEVVRQHLSETPLELPAIPMPPALREVLTQMLVKAPSDRMQSAAAALQLLNVQPEPPPPPIIVEDEPDDTQPTPVARPSPSPEPTQRPKRRKPSVLGMVGVLLSVLLVFVALLELPWWTVPFAALAFGVTVFRL